MKVNGSFSTWTETVIGVPQGSVLGPLLFNIYLNDLFMFMEETEICNYADDTTIYACGSSIESVIMDLENDALKITEWFPNNGMKLYEDKYHLMILGSKRSNEATIKIGEACVKESTEEILLGITFDQSLSFKQHAKALCKKASQKKIPCSCSNITIHGFRKTKAFHWGVRFMSFQLLSACLDVL